MLSYSFVILEENGTATQFAIDDIYWEAASVADVEGPSVMTGVTLSSAPNPFSGSTELRFTLPATDPYEITVVDAGGRRVTGFSGIGRTGANAVRWNGRDERGLAARPGVYYYRLVSGGRSTTGKVMLLK